jgi:membrane protease YdiL (CAAX protease family)
MSAFEENPLPPPDPAAELPEKPLTDENANPNGPLITISPAPYEIPAEPLYSGLPAYPPDLEITWGWAHLVVFGLFAFASLFIVQLGLAFYFLPHGQKLTQPQLEKYLMSKPEFAIGSMVIWYALIFFFLFVTLSLLRGLPFWKSLGWRPIGPKPFPLPKTPIAYFFLGLALSVVVALVTAGLKAPENSPIEELFKNRQSALLFVAMAVLLAPLVEETLFRGYLYPIFARTFGIAPGIIITGVLFGMMHGAQLAWTWALVLTLTAVGIVFTLVRSRTGSVFASYLMHLGYNSLISIAALLSTHGFTKHP